jgi:hypothetical protein
MLLLHDIRLAASRAACTAGNSNPTRMPIIAITTSNSTKVNPRRNPLFLAMQLLQFSQTCIRIHGAKLIEEL